MPPEETVKISSNGSGGTYKPKPRFQNRYLTQASYRKLDIVEILGAGNGAAHSFLARARWHHLPEGEQQCPYCARRGAHYFSAGRRLWKCRNTDCRRQFTVFSGTILHSTKLEPVKFLSIAIHFMEAKDSISAREVSGLHKLNHVPVHVLLLKFREAIRETMLAEPRLSGKIQADAAYFLKYVRPKNVGTGASAAAKNARKKAGITESEKQSYNISPRMHALVVFVQVDKGGGRRYKVAKVKTETQVDVLNLALDFCEPLSTITTDQHKSYILLSGAFIRKKVNHSQEFVTKTGIHTNHAEGFFSRVRHSQAGAWHQVSLQYLEEYGWEMCWRQQVVGLPNDKQLQDLLGRLFAVGPSKRFGNYWGKQPRGEKPNPEDSGIAVEIDKSEVKKRRGRPRKSSTQPSSTVDETSPGSAPNS